MVSQQLIDIIIRAEDRATAIIEKVEARLSNVRQLALGLNNNFNSVTNSTNKLGNSLNRISPNTIRQVHAASLLVQQVFLALSRNIRNVQSELNNIHSSKFNQINNDVKLLDTSLVATKGSANQLDNALDTINVRAISVVDAETGKLKERLLSIIPSAEEVKNALKNIGNVNFSGINEKIEGVKSRLSGLRSSSTSAATGFNNLNMGSRVAGAGLGFLRNAASMTVGMIGYDLFNSVMESGRAAINASSQIEYFSHRLGMSGSDVSTFKGKLNELQGEFRKVNMNAVGAAAEEMAVKLNLGKDSIVDLTEVTAVMSSAFVKEGRTQTDAILAVSDALDGQFKRMQELGISQEMLMQNGWNGDLQDKDSLLKAMNETLKKMGFTQTAKDITNLDDAYQALTVSGGRLMEKILVPITPLLMQMADAAMSACDWIMGAIDGLTSAWNGLPDWAKDAVGVGAFALAISALAIAINIGLVPSISSLAISMITWVIEAMGGTLATESLSFAFGALAFNIWSALAPLLPFIAAAVLLGVAIYEVGKAFGWWTDIGSMIDAIKNNIGRLWDAFINHPDVQGVIHAIGDAWNWLQEQLKPVVDWLKGIWDEIFPESAKGKVDGTRIIIEGIGLAWQGISAPLRMVISILQFLWGVLGSVASAIQTAQSKFGAFGGFLATMASPILFVYECLKKIVCILLGCSPGIVPALQQVSETFSTVWNTIASFVGGIISTVISYIQPLLDIFMQIVSFMIEMFLPVWNLLSSILTVIWNAVSQLINIFQAFLMGQITLPQMLTMIWTLIQTMFMTILTMIINFVFTWAGQLISSAVNAASGFVNNIITWVSSLPGRFWTYLSQTTSNIINAGAQWVSSARQKAGEMVNSASTTVQQLPGRIYTEFSKVPGRIQEAIPQAIQAALNFGKEIINGVLNAMGIHSPGIVQNSIADEFKNTFLKIKDAVKPAGEYAKQVGSAIVEKFGTPKLSLDTEDLIPYQDLDANPLENVDLANVDLASLGGGLDSAMGMTDDTNSMIGESYNALSAMMMTTLNDMVLQDQLAYGQIQSNDLLTFQNISTGLNLNLLSMSTNLRMQLTNMLNTHRLAMTSATNTTRQQLALMLNETMKVTGEMRSAWAVMADSIISAAARIKNEATLYFNQLSTTIGTFYRKLQNPSQWGAGGSTGSPRTTRHVGRDPSIMGRMTGAMAKALRRDNQAPSFISVSSAQRNPFINNSFVDYFNLKPSSRVKTEDLIEGGYIDELHIPLLAKLRGAGWGDVVSPNVNHIKSKAREWQMRGPQLLGYIDSGMAFKVKEFENGKPKISFDSFRKMAEALFSTIQYDFYYDSDKTGSWVTALQTGSVNCSDGADALIALAHTCGLSAYKQHGHWNQFGHFYAMVEGHKMDTTGWQQRRTWTPSASAGPAPRNPLEQLVVDLKEIFSNDSTNSEIVNETNTEEIKLALEHNVNVTVEGNVESVDTDALINELTASITDKRLIDRIADALIKRDKRIARMGGA